jgi:hypothetical protein
VDIDKEPYVTRRTIYGRVDRSDVADVLINFDFANPDMPTGRRHETTVPQQALFLMNSPLVIEQAKHLVALPGFRECSDDTAKIQFLYQRIYQRPARLEEINLGSEFVAEAPEADKVATDENAVRPIADEGQPLRRRPFAGQHGANNARRPPLKAWEEYAHALLQANETSFLN